MPSVKSQQKRTRSERSERSQASERSETSDVEMSDDDSLNMPPSKSAKTSRKASASATAKLIDDQAATLALQLQAKEKDEQLAALRALLAEKDAAAARLQVALADAEKAKADAESAAAVAAAARNAENSAAGPNGGNEVAAVAAVVKAIQPPVAPACASAPFSALVFGKPYPVDQEILLLDTPQAPAPAILALHADAARERDASKIVFVIANADGALLLPSDDALTFVKTLRDASVMRMQDKLRSLKCVFRKHGQRTTCLACLAQSRANKSKPNAKLEKATVGSSAGNKVAGSKCDAPECTENSYDAIIPIVSSASVQPLLDLVLAKYPPIAALAKAMGTDAFADAITSSATIDLKSFDAPCAASIIGHLRTIHHRIPHVIETDADLHGCYDAPDDTPPTTLVYGAYEDEAIRTTFLADGAVTMDMVRFLAAYFEKRRTIARQSSKRSRRTSTSTASEAATAAEDHADENESNENEPDENNENNVNENNDDEPDEENEEVSEPFE